MPPYRKSYGGQRRGGYRRRVYKRPPPTQFQRYAGYATKALSLATKVAGLVNVEYKFNGLIATYTPDSSGNLFGPLLNGLVLGDTASDREGRQIRMKSIQIMIRANLGAAATRTTCRMILVLDKQPNGVAMSGVQLFDIAAVGTVDAMRNLDNRRRFVVLKDKRFVLNTDYPEKVFEIYRKLDIKTIYNNGNAGSVADINTNALYIWFVSDEAANVPSVTCNSRLRWIDN